MLDELKKLNAKRMIEWTGGDELSLEFHGVELAGEVGEVCNEIKKLVRATLGMTGGETEVDDLAEELADVIICVDLIATKAGVDLSNAIRQKFNKTSRKHGFKTKFST